VGNTVSAKGKWSEKVVESCLVPDNLNLMYRLPDGQSRSHIKCFWVKTSTTNQTSKSIRKVRVLKYLEYWNTL